MTTEKRNAAWRAIEDRREEFLRSWWDGDEAQLVPFFWRVWHIMLDGGLACLAYGFGEGWESEYRRILKSCWVLAELSRRYPAWGWPDTPRDIFELAIKARAKAGFGELPGLDQRALWQMVRDPEILLPVLAGDPAFTDSAAAVRLNTDRQVLTSDERSQYTFPEIKALCVALADGPSGRWWSPSDQGASLVHVIPRGALQTEYHPATSSALEYEYRGKPPGTVAEMRGWVRKPGQDGVLLAQIILGHALVSPKQPVRIDDLVNALFDCRSTAERNTRREWVWDTVCVIADMVVIGNRRGKYRDPDTKQLLETLIADRLITVLPCEIPCGAGDYPSGVPVSVGFDGGRWIEAFRHNASMLSYFGNIMQIAGIPGRKPSMAWGRVIALNLNQWWREHAMDAELRSDVTIGPSYQQESAQTFGFTVKGAKQLTRRLLLCGGSGDAAYYQVSPEWDVLKILESDRPARAKEYWGKAIAELIARGIVGHSRPLEDLPPGRERWAEAWLDQPLDIRPAGEGTRNMAAIMRRRSLPGAPVEVETG